MEKLMPAKSLRDGHIISISHDVPYKVRVHRVRRGSYGCVIVLFSSLVLPESGLDEMHYPADHLIKVFE